MEARAHNSGMKKVDSKVDIYGDSTNVEDYPLAKYTNIINPKTGDSLLRIAQATSNQAELDAIYQDAVKYYSGSQTGKIVPDAFDHPLHKRTILFWAISCFQGAETINHLLDLGSNPKEEYYDDFTGQTSAFFTAISLGNLPAVKSLLQRNKQFISVDTALGAMPAHMAIENDSADILQIFFDIEPSITKICVAATHFSLLHFAIESNKPRSVEWLIEHDKEICNYKDIHGRTPLCHAVEKGQLNFVNSLLRVGADYNIPNRFNHSPLQIAAKTGNNDIVCALLRAGATSTLTNPVDIAKLNEEMQTVFKLQDYENRRNQAGKYKTGTLHTFYGSTAINYGARAFKKAAAIITRIPTKLDKTQASKKIRENLLNHAMDILDGLSPEERYAALEPDSELGLIVIPLVETSKTPSPRSSPNRSQESSPILEHASPKMGR